MNDINAWSAWADIVWKAGTVIGLVWLALQQRSKANASKLDAHSERLDNLEQTIAAIKNQLDAVKKIDTVIKNQAAMEASLKVLTNNVQQLIDNELAEGRAAKKARGKR
ncbi:MAG: hypothetical protein AAF442_04930 [Pseudomonadota bacterium]